MSSSEGHCVRSRQPTLPPLCSRTLHHPSFLPLYMAARPHGAGSSSQTVCPPVHPITPAEVFYTDPTMGRGRRIPNIVRQLRVFDSFRLSTPPPVMTSCPAPPTRPDPFRSGPHPTRDLGSLTLKINTLHPPVQPSRVVLQLSPEEDQAITNLLKLHHQGPLHSEKTFTAPQMDFCRVDLNPIPFLSPPQPMEAYKPFCSGLQHTREASLQGQQGRCWSDTELEAANTLLNRFSLIEKDKTWGQNHNNSAATLPDPLPHQQQGSETFFITAGYTQNRERGERGCGDLRFVEGRNADDVPLPVCEEYVTSSSPSSDGSSSVSGGFSEVKERTLSDSEGDAVQVLLSLGDMGALDIVQ
ncbi:uncharacterized protein LOC123980873 isoform X1 [Micropterus dolomieu]|uniref:uncharacterized protein LOC123980873 isoform X1 n=1 Tax=Micropterus dolomieu TaxID=147949 RepID=UPI001E8D7225|nr:uncharacterized protein LOC123980873 isoform X1 [Micropterus dolomieu]